MKPKFLLRERLPSLRTLYAVQKVPYARVFFVAVTGVRRFRTLGTLIRGARFKLWCPVPVRMVCYHRERVHLYSLLNWYELSFSDAAVS